MKITEAQIEAAAIALWQCDTPDQTPGWSVTEYLKCMDRARAALHAAAEADKKALDYSHTRADLIDRCMHGGE